MMMMIGLEDNSDAMLLKVTKKGSDNRLISMTEPL